MLRLFRLFFIPALLVMVLCSFISGKKNTPDPKLFMKKSIKRATDIVEFNAISDGRKVVVNWEADGEKTYDYYTIEKAKDGVHFEAALMIKSAGISNAVDYIDIDYTPYSGISYYRIKQTDYSGESSYSDVVRVNYQFANDGTILSCRDIEPIDLKQMDKKEILVVLRDQQGIEYVSKVLLAENTGNGSIYATDIRSRLKKGNYTVIASSYNRLFSQTLVIP